jgi:hypothetical protein
MSSDGKGAIPVERVKQLMTACAQYFDDKASEREVQNCVDDLVGGALADLSNAERALQASVAYYASTSRRELAEKILLKLIEIAPTAFDNTNSESPNEGARLAWSIADAFLKAEQP